MDTCEKASKINCMCVCACGVCVWGEDNAIDARTKCNRTLEEETEEPGEDSCRDWCTGPLALVGSGWSCGGTGFFLCLLHVVVITVLFHFMWFDLIHHSSCP